MQSRHLLTRPPAMNFERGSFWPDSVGDVMSVHRGAADMGGTGWHAQFSLAVDVRFLGIAAHGFGSYSVI